MPDTDLRNRADIEQVLTAFYKKAFADEHIGYFFTEVVPLNLKTHLPLIADFWEAIIFNTQGYRKNVMEIHQQISEKSTISKKHLHRWVHLFVTTVDGMFAGEKAELMKQRAQSVATLMNIKLASGKINGL
ncbi:MAG: group III truncated hemoglobin [Bacteroidota bacterium]